MRKVYCFVDESGLTNESLFIVSLILVADPNRANAVDRARQVAVTLDRQTGKRGKWAKTDRPTRAAYAEKLFTTPEFAGVMFCAVYNQPGEYLPRLLRAIATILLMRPPGDTLIVSIDALPVIRVPECRKYLRAQGLRIEGIRPCTDDNEPLVMVADAVAGIVRAARDETQPLAGLLDRAVASKKITIITLD